MTDQEKKEWLQKQIKNVNNSIEIDAKIAEIEIRCLEREEARKIERENMMELLKSTWKLKVYGDPNSDDAVASIYKKALAGRKS